MNFRMIYTIVCLVSIMWLAYAERTGVVFMQAVSRGPGRIFGQYQHK